MFSIKRNIYKLIWLLVAIVVVSVYFNYIHGSHLYLWKGELKNTLLSTKQQEQEQGEVEVRNKIRIARIKQACNTISNVTQPHLRRSVRAIMDPNYDITYCRVNKVASTYTIEMLTKTFNCSIDRMRDAAQKVHALPYKEMRDIIDHSYKFTFVREPYGRLFSAYSNKFYFPKTFWAPLGPAIVRRYRKNPSKDGLIYGHDITFHEMIRYMVDQYESGRPIDEHLRPMNYNCFPCDYQYDFIGKLETIETDWVYLRDLWAKDRHIAILPKTAGQVISKKFPSLVHIPKTLALIKNSTISLYKLYYRAWSYYQITGHIYKHIEMPFEENSRIVYAEFKRALEVAAEESKPYATEMKLQKSEALKQAYASVPIQLLERLTKIFEIDCMLYGYDNKPDWLFDSGKEQIEFNYFRGLD